MRLVVRLQKIVLEIAGKGKCVIVGRGAPYFLRDREDAFHVFLYAPYGEKRRRIVEWGKSRKEAQQLLESVDSERAAFVRKYYNKEWPDRCLYHMMLNVTTDDAAVQAIMTGIEQANTIRAHA